MQHLVGFVNLYLKYSAFWSRNPTRPLSHASHSLGADPNWPRIACEQIAMAITRRLDIAYSDRVE